MAGKWHLGHAYRRFLPGSRGFDSSYGCLNGAIEYYTHMRDRGLDWHRDGKTLVEEGYSTDLIGAEAVRRIRQRDKAKPFLLYVPFNSPHTPLQAPPELIDKYAAITSKNRRIYAAMVDAMDTNIGRILGALKDENVENDTIVLFFSDNGGPTALGASNGALRGSKGTTFEGGIRVPACIRYPGHIGAGSEIRQVMTVWDLFPTLAAATQVVPGNRRPFDGVDLWPVLTRKAQPRRREDLFFSVDSGKGNFYAVLSGEWKLVLEESRQGGEPRQYLFRIGDDPNESADLSKDNAAIVNDLTARIAKWRTSAAPEHSEVHSNNQPPGFRVPAQWAEASRP
jgi:arylsulfatase A-like enzyme